MTQTEKVVQLPRYSARRAVVTDQRSPGGSFRRQSLEVTNMIDRRTLEVLYIQEAKWKGDRARTLAGGYKMLHAGGDGKRNGVGIIVSEKISKDVTRVEIWQRMIIVAWMMMKKTTCMHYVCVSSRKGGDGENGLHGRAVENGGFGGSACDDAHTWRF